ncbi:galactosylceramide sulfotransferase-like [Patiria miniata]|uniref:Galactosylceramide sulfotransferase-like n=1 Tax=Patiria miniata TaxID=46514 RepID=A0A914BA47_PATMI|nr:galactosylceramide sulfotransferase-like [Patiria miniata]
MCVQYLCTQFACRASGLQEMFKKCSRNVQRKCRLLSKPVIYKPSKTSQSVLSIYYVCPDIVSDVTTVVMTLSKQVASVGLAVFLLLMVTVGYIQYDGIKHVVVDTSSKLRSSGIKSSLPNLHKFLGGTEGKTKNLTRVADVSTFLLKTLQLNATPNISRGTERQSEALQAVLIHREIAKANNASSSQAMANHDRAPSTNQGSGKSCNPRTNIVFFKMHKCSSSTIQNILFRYGEAHVLDFVLPPAGNYLGHSAFNKRYMIKFPVEEYNILCHHTVFNAKGMAEVMPVNSVYATILRDPVPMFESLFTYNNMAWQYHLPNNRGLELFLKKPEYYYRIADGGILHIKNPMLYGLGLPKAYLGDQSAIDRKIEELKGQFDLVMMTEYFDESLVLLRDLMCWEFDDVVYFVQNARSKSAVKAVSPQAATKIRKWNYGDTKLYETFNRTFWEKVEAFGFDRMKKEVAQLRERNEYYKKRCIAEVTNKNDRVWHPPGIPVDSFLLKKEASNDVMCNRMAEPELLYTAQIRQIQKKRYGMQ